MKKPLLIKSLLLGFLFFLFLVPLGMLKDLALERKARGDEVVAGIAESTFRSQSVAGPLLVLPYRQTVRWTDIKVIDNQRTEQPMVRVRQGHLLVPPETLHVKAGFGVETRARQLYEAHLLHADTIMTGSFRVPPRAQLEQQGNAQELVTYEWLQPWLVVGVADARGIGALQGSLGAAALEFSPGSRLVMIDSGVHAPLDIALADRAFELPYRLEMAVSGTDSLAFLPVGQSTTVDMQGEWPHPSFFGNQLPTAHAETDKTFTASWKTTHIASGITADTLNACEVDEKCALGKTNAFGVRLVDPVDRYLMTDRTVKYASLFLLLTFGACFLVEVIKAVRVHPVQYLLVGAAQAMFFLLVLALAEHVSFALAYLCAAVCIVLLLGYYASAVLGGWKRGTGFAGVVALLYGMLFGILQSEDTALLMGALGLLLALATVMALTRRVDWYGFGSAVDEAPANAVVRS